MAWRKGGEISSFLLPFIVALTSVLFTSSSPQRNILLLKDSSSLLFFFLLFSCVKSCIAAYVQQTLWSQNLVHGLQPPTRLEFDYYMRLCHFVPVTLSKNWLKHFLTSLFSPMYDCGPLAGLPIPKTVKIMELLPLFPTSPISYTYHMSQPWEEGERAPRSLSRHPSPLPLLLRRRTEKDPDKADSTPLPPFCHSLWYGIRRRTKKDPSRDLWCGIPPCFQVQENIFLLWEQNWRNNSTSPFSSLLLLHLRYVLQRYWEHSNGNKFSSSISFCCDVSCLHWKQAKSLRLTIHFSTSFSEWTIFSNKRPPVEC